VIICGFERVSVGLQVGLLFTEPMFQVSRIAAAAEPAEAEDCPSDLDSVDSDSDDPDLYDPDSDDPESTCRMLSILDLPEPGCISSDGIAEVPTEVSAEGLFSELSMGQSMDSPMVVTLFNSVPSARVTATAKLYPSINQLESAA
jgi:hypothetical protein